MSTRRITHSAGLSHLTPPGHPEAPERLRAVEHALEAEKFSDLAREQAPLADLETVALCHPIDYVERMRDISPREGMVSIDDDTSMSPGTFEAALRAVGGATLAIDEVVEKKAHNVFVAMRPPGHHAEIARPMGFCIFNQAAIAARYAQRKYGLERAAVIDIDVHHGNGTQDIFWKDPTLMYCSTHEMPLYPGTGAKDECGDHNNIVNAPLRAGDGGQQFREAMENVILPRLEAFSPDIVIISAGFDAHIRDPLGNINLVEDDFIWTTCKLIELANRRADGRLISILEGGYDLEGLARSTAAHVSALMHG